MMENDVVISYSSHSLISNLVLASSQSLRQGANTAHAGREIRELACTCNFGHTNVDAWEIYYAVAAAALVFIKLLLNTHFLHQTFYPRRTQIICFIQR